MLPEIELGTPPAAVEPTVAVEPAAAVERRAPFTRRFRTRTAPAAPFRRNGERVDDAWRRLPDLRPLGQIHESFIIAAGRDGLWIIDQHVAHERILFEQVLRQRAAGRVEIQQLLMPMVLQLTAGAADRYARIADELHALGFRDRAFRQAHDRGESRARRRSVRRYRESPVRDSGDRRKRTAAASLDDIRRDIAASIACRAAIKINMRLDLPKMEWLLRALAGDDCPMSCPHGRPIALRYRTKDILRSFHRI